MPPFNFRNPGKRKAAPAAPAASSAPASGASAKSDLSTLFDLLDNPESLALLDPIVPRANPFQRWVIKRRADRLTKAVGTALIKGLSREQDAAKDTGAVVNATMDVFNAYGGSSGVVGVADPTGVTFRLLRQMAHHCEPAAAIIEKRVQQVAAFARPGKVRGAYVEQAGWRISLTEEEAEPTDDDIQQIQKLKAFIENCGSCPPPESARSANWQPGFEAFLRQIARDTLTMDWVAIRRFPSARNPRMRPCVAFVAEDAARIRRYRGRVIGVVNGKKVRDTYPKTRRTTGEQIKFLKMSDDQGGGVEEELTEEEIAVAVRNPRTDELAFGYGYSELERAINAVSIWLYARDYNANRFRMDALPRGILVLLGKLNQSQLDTFKLRWKEMFEGVDKRWGFPIISGEASEKGGSSVANWISLDQASREMEYHQFMFSVSLWMHSLFGIHPDETGYEALSPFRPPLSEASPETKLQYSQDTGLTPLMRFLEDLVNREIVAKVDKTGRYRFEWVGLGDQDRIQDAQAVLLELQAGRTNPLKVARQVDLQLPDWLKDCPAVEMPMPLMQGFGLLIQLWQLYQSQQQTQQASLQAQQAQMMGMAGAGPGGAGAGPPGASAGGAAAGPPAAGMGAPMMGRSPGMPGAPEGMDAAPEEEATPYLAARSAGAPKPMGGAPMISRAIQKSIDLLEKGTLPGTASRRGRANGRRRIPAAVSAEERLRHVDLHIEL